jgi:hypothetical protein
MSIHEAIFAMGYDNLWESEVTCQSSHKSPSNIEVCTCITSVFFKSFPKNMSWIRMAVKRYMNAFKRRSSEEFNPSVGVSGNF